MKCTLGGRIEAEMVNMNSGGGFSGCACRHLHQKGKNLKKMGKKVLTNEERGGILGKLSDSGRASDRAANKKLQK